MDSAPEVTQLLMAWSNGDAAALERLVPLVQSELQRIARHYLQQEQPGYRLQTTELVNEAWLRLMNWHHGKWQNRAHFFSVAAQLMRRVLVDEARERHACKRGCGALQVSLSHAEELCPSHATELVALDDVLNSLAELDPRKSQIVELRFFGGLSVKETAAALKLSERTIAREWDIAQAWLFRELQRETHVGCALATQHRNL